jgi:sugar phosphate isomerase/epimerase
MGRRLDEIGYEGPILLEVFNTAKPEYRKLTCDEFIAECATRARRIANMSE